jgi:hypothetical protein
MMLRVIIVLLVAITGCLIWSERATVLSQSATPLRRELTLQEKRGKAFYL